MGSFSRYSRFSPAMFIVKLTTNRKEDENGTPSIYLVSASRII